MLDFLIILVYTTISADGPFFSEQVKYYKYQYIQCMRDSRLQGRSTCNSVYMYMYMYVVDNPHMYMYMYMYIVSNPLSKLLSDDHLLSKGTLYIPSRESLGSLYTLYMHVPSK